MSDQRIVIVGAGQAAAQAVETLRKRGHTGPITLIGDEASLPYQRPPLSKKYLAGSLDRDRLLFRHAAHYAEHDVMLRLGFPVVSLDRLRRRVEIADGSALPYDALLLATGTHSRLLPLPGAELVGVHYLRTVADVDRLRAELSPGRRAVIVGGGYIGLEVAATCREAGLDVVVLETTDRVMKRVVAPEVSRFYEAEHARHGVKIVCNARIDSLVPGRSGVQPHDEVSSVAPAATLFPDSRPGTERVAAVRLADGSDIPADFVLVAIGVLPTDALAREAGPLLRKRRRGE